jgi:hypothetical protein
MIVCLDAVKPETACSYLGRRPAHLPDGQRPAERAKREIDYGRRGNGQISGVFGQLPVMP